MDFNNWYVPGKGVAKNEVQVRISTNFISISRYCLNKYFVEKPKARVGYNSAENILIIMPTDENDELGLRLIGKETSNFKYLNAKNFISSEGLAPPSNKKSIKHKCTWDEENKWLIAENVKK